MKKLVELNKPALWRSIRSDEVSVRHYSQGYPHSKNGIALVSGDQSPAVVRYAKNYKKFNKDFSLCMFTYEKDISKVESFFESLVKIIKKSDINEALVEATASNFKYIDVLYEGDK